MTDRLALSLAALALSSAAVAHPVLSVSLRPQDLDSYMQRVGPLLEMSQEAVLALIPKQSGLYFCDCVNCDFGRQEGQFKSDSGSKFIPWSPEEPDVLRCGYCGHEYPSAKYPANGALEVTNPRGEVQKYPYFEDAGGYRHHHAARLDYHKIRYMERAANTLARIYTLTQEPRYARLAALIMHRFSQVYPGYCYHYDYPFREKIIYSGDVPPADFRSGFRTARWTWWAYVDIPQLLIEAYDLIAASGVFDDLPAGAAADTEGFFTAAAGQVLANKDDLGNMSPGMWADAIEAGRVLGKPEYVHVAIGRLRRLMTGQFFYDGVWKEGAPSYHAQVIGNLGHVFRAAKGYSDPLGYTDPDTGERFDDLDAEADLPLIARSGKTLMQMRLPNGRFVPVHDTWSTNARAALEQSSSYLLPGLGHACLGRGAGDAQVQAHLTWSGGYGHTHYDGLSLLLFAHGKELLSDLGYTHTKGRAWTLCTPSHNTVVVDCLSQTAGGGEDCTYGSLRLFDAASDLCQIVSVDNPRVYPDLVTRYRRTIALIAIDDASSYLVDLFQVAGGSRHDYFLHGSADEPQKIASEGPWSPLATLLPEGIEFTPAQNESEAGKAREDGYAYGYLTNPARRTIRGDAMAELSWAYRDDAPRLIAHVAVSAGDELIQGQNPSIRPAQEDDGEIDRHHRVFALIRRTGGDSAFAAVIEPALGEPKLAAVRRLAQPGAEIALEVELVSGRRDLILLEPTNATFTWRDMPLTASAELVYASSDDDRTALTVAGGTASWGDLSLRAPLAEHALLAVDRDARTITVDGSFAPAEGSVITVDHAGSRVSPYTVVSTETAGASTRITVLEDPGFEYNPDARASTFVFVPHTSYTGDHLVRQHPVAHATGR